ncbi:hypothetical protein GQ55_2G135500 [Panicum hallii var. hallii]|uniref:Uncharacterized protein n=1 Tax=Panicum hallii var. hallii TaxID=1504633 RepID=A0A2T7EPH9_9POAL|nr:hypothetical protein GQ55_2G135500 [Panicum hallii var. hallii]
MNRAEAIRSLPHRAGSGKNLFPPFPSALASCPSPRRPSVGRWSLAACPCPPVGAWPSELGKTSIHATPELARPPEVHSRPPKLEQPPSSIRGPPEVARPLEVDSWHLELTQPPELGRGSNRATPELALPLEVDSRRRSSLERYQTDCFGEQERRERKYPGARSRAERSRLRALPNAR